MSVMRRLLLAGSQSAWLRERAMRTRFVRRSVARFMPGESMGEALDACQALGRGGPGTILTHLGENLTSAGEAEQVRDHYLELLGQIEARGVDTQVSVKLTQLGLDLDQALCFSCLSGLIQEAERRGNFIWIDMEATPYVEPTLALFRRARAHSARVGLCLQAYLYRTAADLEGLLPLGPAIRLVKGAYQEPPDLAFPKKRDVDENYFALASRLLSPEAVARGARLGIGTHDPGLVSRLQRVATSNGTSRTAFEFEMLYGIQRGLQASLVREQWPLRVLVSYGEMWFPWYMRRLAERPANVWFVVKGMAGR